MGNTVLDGHKRILDPMLRAEASLVMLGNGAGTSTGMERKPTKAMKMPAAQAKLAS